MQLLAVVSTLCVSSFSQAQQSEIPQSGKKILLNQIEKLTQEPYVIPVTKGDVVSFETVIIPAKRKTFVSRTLKGVGALFVGNQLIKRSNVGKYNNSSNDKLASWIIPAEIGIVLSSDLLKPTKSNDLILYLEEFNSEKEKIRFDKFKLNQKNTNEKFNIVVENDGYVRISFVNSKRYPITNGSILIQVNKKEVPIQEFINEKQLGEIMLVERIKKEQLFVNLPSTSGLILSKSEKSIIKITPETETKPNEEKKSQPALSQKNAPKKLSPGRTPITKPSKKNYSAPIRSKRENKQKKNKKLIPVFLKPRRGKWFEENEEELPIDNGYIDLITKKTDSDSYSWIGPMPDYSLPDVVVEASRPRPEPPPPEATPSWYSYEDPETGYGGGDDEIYDNSNPCDKQREIDNGNTAQYIYNTHSAQINNLALERTANNEKAIGMGWVTNYPDGSPAPFSRASTPVTTGTANNVAPDLNSIPYFKADSSAHTHPVGTDPVPSPRDLYYTAINAAPNSSWYEATFIIAIPSGIGPATVYTLVVHDKTKAAAFKNLFPDSSNIDNSTNNFYPTSPVGIEYFEALNSFISQGFSSEKASANAMAYVLAKFDTGITLMKKRESDNTFHSINSQKITHGDSQPYFITRNC